MNQPARRKTDANATGTNQPDVTGVFCGKLLNCPASDLAGRQSSAEDRKNTRFAFQFTVKPPTGHGGVARTVIFAGAGVAADFEREVP
jgi:hypothetical protein